MFRAILVCHDEKKYTGDEPPFSPSDQEATAGLASFMGELNLKPQLVLRSNCNHARQTAEALAKALGIDPHVDPPKIRAIDALNHGLETDSQFSTESIIDQARAKGSELRDDSTVFLVGNGPPLRQLATMMTSMGVPPLDRFECICIHAPALNALRVGRGRLMWRWRSPRPIPRASAEELRPKLTSKMTVAALLAGFNFNALLGLVKDPEKPQLECFQSETLWPPTVQRWSTFPALSCGAIISLTISMGLFMTAIYVYDRLSMPQNFLKSPLNKPFLTRWSQGMEDRLKGFGFVYAAMIYTWWWIFTPAVWLAVCGFLLIVARASPRLSGGVLCVILLILLYYWLARPGYSKE